MACCLGQARRAGTVVFQICLNARNAMPKTYKTPPIVRYLHVIHGSHYGGGSSTKSGTEEVTVGYFSVYQEVGRQEVSRRARHPFAADKCCLAAVIRHRSVDHQSIPGFLHHIDCSRNPAGVVVSTWEGLRVVAHMVEGVEHYTLELHAPEQYFHQPIQYHGRVACHGGGGDGQRCSCWQRHQPRAGGVQSSGILREEKKEKETSSNHGSKNNPTPIIIPGAVVITIIAIRITTTAILEG